MDVVPAAAGYVRDRALAPGPWYDYLAIPVAPLVIAAQALALAIPQPRVRRWVAFVGAGAVVAMFLIVVGAGFADGMANIGAGLLLPMVLLSLYLARQAGV